MIPNLPFALRVFLPTGVVLVATIGPGAEEAAAECYYTYTIIPNPPGQVIKCVAAAINSNGQVAGHVASLSSNSRAFLWSPESGTLVLPLPPGVNDMRALGLNDLGHVCGWVNAPDGDGLLGFIWDGRAFSVIERPAWVNSMEAYEINNAGQVAGMMTNVITRPAHAFVWQDGILLDLGPSVAAGYSLASGVNERGDVVGYGAEADPFHRESFLFDGVDVRPLPHPNELDSSMAKSVSNNRFVVGTGKTEDPLHFFGVVWTPWSTHVIAPPPEYRDARLEAVNDAGRAVGYYDRRVGGGQVPIVWQFGTVTDLRTLVQPPGPEGLELALAINNTGQIAATYRDGSVVLSPVWRLGDITGDCRVGIDDLALVLSNFGASGGTYPIGDVDLDGDVDLSDLAFVLSHWGE